MRCSRLPSCLFQQNNNNNNIEYNNIRRRLLLSSLPAAMLLPLNPQTAESLPWNRFREKEDSLEDDNDTIILDSMDTPYTPSYSTIRVPLHYIPRLSAYVVYYRVGLLGERFGAIVDTGSPFLMIPNYCQPEKWGCYRPEASTPSGLPDTFERFDNNQGMVEWRKAPFSFDKDATGSLLEPAMFTFGVLSESLMDGPGGVFLGLVRDTDDWIRPSFLGQTAVKSFQIDLQDQEDNNNKSLTLSTSPTLISDRTDWISLTKDLNQKYGDPTIHYTAKAISVTANGTPLASNDGKPIYVIFDTGVTGMVVSQELFDERYMTARQNRERSLWKTVEITFATGTTTTTQTSRRQQRRQRPKTTAVTTTTKTTTLTANKPVTTPLGDMPWPNFNDAHLIVIGLAFLDGHKMTVEIDKQRLWMD